MYTRWFPLLLVPGFILCGLFADLHDRQVEAVRPRYTTEEMLAAKESIALSLMGQLQITAHSLVWMKTLEYLHNGVALRMPTPAEEQRGFRAREATDVSTGLAHKCGVPLTLNKAMDWRGPVGVLHRTIAPHMEIHRHSDPIDLIPWYRLTLKLNPNVERLYTLAAFFLADNAGEPEDARRLLEAGIEANPWTFEIRAALGRLLFDYHQQLAIPPAEAYEQTAHILQEAITTGKYEQAYLKRRNSAFDPYQEQLLRESYLFLAKSFTELGRFEKALKVCDEGYEATRHNHLKVQRRITAKQMQVPPELKEPPT
ncbi:MAG: tetratricopeptide repeat protein [Candidatus Hydrogenedentota bacterium]